jgi:hypothetical protein
VYLPNGDRAFIDLRKLLDYSLCPSHPVGAHKARLFKEALGIESQDAECMAELLGWVAAHAIAADEREDPHGKRYSIDFALETGNRSAAIRSAWIIRSGEDFPRLTTVFVLISP